MIRKSYLFIICFLLIGFVKLNAQTEGYKLGADVLGRYNSQSGFFDLSDPDAINIKVSVWGFVRYPGKYLVPIYTNVTELLSYAGGPTDAAHLDDLRLYRLNSDSTQQLIKLNYDDLMWATEIKSVKKKSANLEASDILIVPGAPRIYTREAVSLWVSIIAALTSLTILILNITKN